jgi:predicted ATPase
LRAKGEWLHRPAPLELPPEAEARPTAAEALGYSAVELFNERATATDGFMLDDGNMPTVLEICRRLDGIPLAIELAAALAPTLGVETLAAHLGHRFDLLTGGRRTLPRHQTLRATLDWSYELLPEPERILLRRLAIFAGPFSLEAVRTVVESPELAASEVIEGISNLFVKSLVVTEVESANARYRLLDSTRAYALEKLLESGERDRIARRHAEHYRDLFGQAEAEQEGLPTAEWLGAYGWQINNLRVPLDWAFSPDGNASIGVALTAAAVPLWMHLSLVAECRERCDRGLLELQTKHMPDGRLRMRLQIGLGNSLLHTRGPSEQAQIVLTEALESEALGDLRANCVFCWISRASLAFVANTRGRPRRPSVRWR